MHWWYSLAGSATVCPKNCWYCGLTTDEGKYFLDLDLLWKLWFGWTVLYFLQLEGFWMERMLVRQARWAPPACGLYLGHVKYELSVLWYNDIITKATSGGIGAAAAAASREFRFTIFPLDSYYYLLSLEIKLQLYCVLSDIHFDLIEILYNSLLHTTFVFVIIKLLLHIGEVVRKIWVELIILSGSKYSWHCK